MATREELIEQIKELTNKHFPFPKANPGQKESIVWIVLQFITGVKHVVIQAPTGAGKSAIATTVHRVLRDLKPNFRSTITTATKGLQDQYVEMDRSIYDLKGKSNYDCPHGKGPYNTGACRAHCSSGKCNKYVECPYVMRRVHWCEKADLRSSNSSFQIEACPAICMELENKANLIIVDECHDIDDHIVEHTTVRYVPFHYAFLIGFGYSAFKRGLEELNMMFQPYSKVEFFDAPADIVEKSLGLNRMAEGIIEDFSEQMKNPSIPKARKEEIGDALEFMQQIADKLAIFSNSREGGKWIVNAWTKEEVEVKPVFAWQVADYALFRKADIFLHMSATICGIDEYASTLGLTDFVYGEIPNPIPVENRLVYVLPKFRMNAGFDDFKALGNFIGELRKRHLPSNGLIHCVSFKLGNSIYQSLPDRTGAFITGDRQEILDEMMKTNSSALCISPSIEKGYDFKGDTSRYQIIAKVPYLYLGDPLIKLNSEYRSGWYARKAILRIIQAAGRSIRGVDDFATTYIIDSSFTRLLNENRHMFPEWFLDSLRFVN